ncbi:hypothetical protein A2331_04360 [Candidatus Falkowbacteria bacterium RIFOXYB2_FULL_34_18]|uniref:Band 7 domain-containing protein n=1 Tax=Candidatus Falkowbacteria bacterium RIFOXYD2_FULL_34_120 TaxID=1798007 RepID=A0A1F5TMB6_9BACT|nr:MAG: hypothetical protein A2331_04360 [Candidatus Falkowbacteria bacterium RIFOXYB2_FULL_34_18]OGF30270.1 MAG: hypothetical protein A2500_06740 [Candidatus Falkowbacteria bacterium RIFOXYC12_FULL_34_55]OGF37821.1 MAG: hypothetical protein A2466_03865 [Candidatus Falkowbacteria bacterium RIFOXYC2_FULL_34_220]OGF39582.1 MAG: hypothetical protein A2515_03580 [Candidatus Falkowbacteria bacterium RIFOXYD12_FULL_34_57]OGF40006.1 MAG: hypothetical protein A2531_07310 [Candidatus Falkowbacteria bact
MFTRHNEKVFKFLPLILFFVFFILPSLGKNGFFILLIIILFFVVKNIVSGYKNDLKIKDMSKIIDVDKIKFMNKTKHSLISIILLVLVFWLFFASIVIVDAGETGVYSLFGRVKDKELSSGFHLVIPLAKVAKMSIRTEEYTMSIAQGEGKRVGADAITSLTKEGLSVDLDMTVLYRLNEEQASDLYSKVGLNYEEKILRPAIRTSIRDIIAQYEAKDIYSEKREEAADKILEALRNNVVTRGVIVEDVMLRNVSLPAGLTSAIQEKLKAEQEAQKYEFLLDREMKEKQRKIIEAEGQRDAQQIINESLTTNYLYYLYISDLKSREGTIYVPTSPTTGMPLFKNLGN